MKTSPILFTGPMVRAILDGRKTQTRRLVSPQPIGPPDGLEFHHTGISTKDGAGWWTPRVGGQVIYCLPDGPDGVSADLRCPYGAPGDRLYVRETWALSKRAPADTTDPEWVWYRADNHGDSDIVDGKWRPSIFMPRWASRITLDITDVRVERLNDITEEDAKAEGAQRFDDIPDHSQYGQGGRWSMMKTPASTDECFGSARMAFANAWDSINSKRAPWSLNPWVWVVTLKRIEP